MNRYRLGSLVTGFVQNLTLMTRVDYGTHWVHRKKKLKDEFSGRFEIL